MSLLEQAFDTPFVILDKKTRPDGEGGVVTEWTDGATIKAAAVLDTSMEARIGEKQGVTALYTITTRKSVVLRFHDVLRRVKDGKTFRVTSDGDDKATPTGARLDMRQVTAEEWELS